MKQQMQTSVPPVNKNVSLISYYKKSLPFSIIRFKTFHRDLAYLGSRQLLA